MLWKWFATRASAAMENISAQNEHVMNQSDHFHPLKREALSGRGPLSSTILLKGMPLRLPKKYNRSEILRILKLDQLQIPLRLL